MNPEFYNRIKFCCLALIISLKLKFIRHDEFKFIIEFFV